MNWINIESNKTMSYTPGFKRIDATMNHKKKVIKQ